MEVELVLLRVLSHLFTGVLLSALFVTGCSMFQTSRESVDSQQGSKSISKVPAGSDVVSRAQYDDLLRRYEQLNRSYQKSSDKNGMQSKLSSFSEPAAVPGAKAPMSKMGSSESLVETVEVFPSGASESKMANYDMPSKQIIENDKDLFVPLKIDEAQLESEIASLRKAIDFLDKNDFSKAMEVFQSLERAKYPQVRVRAKFYMGELLYKQNEYDLAFQIYEDVIKKFAFSGLVIQSLKRLVTCSKKLNLSTKGSQYKAVLKDYFGIRI